MEEEKVGKNNGEWGGEGLGEIGRVVFLEKGVKGIFFLDVIFEFVFKGNELVVFVIFWG